jgi:sarcosine oxidase, subunit gamma
MAEPGRTTALDGEGAVLAALGGAAVGLASQVSLRVDPDSARAAGLPLPRTPNTWTGNGPREALWLGPDEWLVVSDVDPAEEVVAGLQRSLAGRHHSALDVSANRVVIELRGPRRLELLEAGCGLDLHPRSWREGMCAQTLLANLVVLLQERHDATRIFLRPSFAHHLVAWLERAAVRR